MKISMLDLKREYEYMKADIDAAIKRCLEHQQWILGPEVKELEEKVAQYLSAQYCIGTSSGTDALVLALRALAIKRKGKEYFERTRAHQDRLLGVQVNCGWRRQEAANSGRGFQFAKPSELCRAERKRVRHHWAAIHHSGAYYRYCEHLAADPVGS